MKKAIILSAFLIIKVLSISTAQAETHLLNTKNELLGLFETAEDYQKALETLVDSAKVDIVNYLDFAKEETLPRLQKFDHFLDIGPGTGELTIILGRDFKQITLLDNKSTAFSKLDFLQFPNCSYLEKIISPIQEFSIPEKKYDLINLSHVLYYIPRGDWLEVVKKLYAGLKQDGLMVITMNDGGEKMEFLQHFGGDSFHFEEFIHDAQQELRDAQTEVFIKKGGVTVKNMDAMLRVLGFYLLDIGQLTSIDNGIDYINNNITPDSAENLSMNSYQYFFVIKKM